MPKVSDKYLNNLVDFVEGTGAVLSKVAEQEEKIASFGPAVVDALIKQGCISKESRADAIAATRDPIKVLESLKTTAEYLGTKRAQIKEASDEKPLKMGEGQADGIEKVAARDTDNWGRKASIEKEAANRRFLRTFISSH
jgi:hypothetical protein